jgi:hypothetical protein
MTIAVRVLEISQNEDLNNGSGLTWGFATALDGNVQNRLVANIQAVNFSGCSAKLDIRQGQTQGTTLANLLLALTSAAGQITFGTYTDSTGATWGTISVFVTAAQSATLPAGAWNFDLQVTNAGGFNEYYVEGPCIVHPTGTR